MAVAFDAVGPSSAGTGTLTQGTPLTWTHTAVGSGVAIVVGIANGHDPAAAGTLTVTCDGNAMTPLGSVTTNGGTAGTVFLLGIAGQASGAHAMSASVSGGSGVNWSLVAGSVSYTGADPGSPFGAVQTAAGSSTAPAATLTGTTAGNMVAGVAAIGSATLTNPATSRWTDNFTAINGAGNAGQADQAAGGSVTFTWSDSSSDDWGVVLVEIVAGGAAPPPSVQKFYLHDAATGNTGTLPSGENSASTASVTATGANTQRAMDGTAGVSQTSIALTTLANTSAQPCLFRMFESAPLAAQTVSSGNWQLSMAGSESNANSNLHFTACVYAWRPSTGAVVGSLVFDLAAASTGEPGTTETAVSDATISGGSVTLAGKDILVCEIWRDTTVQGTATARTNTFFYDGTTEASASSNAAYLLAPAAVLLYVPPPAQPLVVAQAVKRASFY